MQFIASTTVVVRLRQMKAACGLPGRSIGYWLYSCT